MSSLLNNLSHAILGLFHTELMQFLKKRKRKRNLGGLIHYSKLMSSLSPLAPCDAATGHDVSSNRKLFIGEGILGMVLNLQKFLSA